MATAPAEWKRYIRCKAGSVCNGSIEIGSNPELPRYFEAAHLHYTRNANTHYTNN